MISPAQCRAARGLLDWTPQELARRAGLSFLSIQAFERGRAISDTDVQAIILAFEAAGVHFIAENGGGEGLRRRQPRGV
jgi:transcriptional regulator with XRE-family HTH domain